MLIRLCFSRLLCRVIRFVAPLVGVWGIIMHAAAFTLALGHDCGWECQSMYFKWEAHGKRVELNLSSLYVFGSRGHGLLV
jgi:hypothetical protein